MLSLSALTSGCYVSKEEFQKKAEDAAACVDEVDTCVAVGPECMCPIPVNEKRAEELRDVAEAVFCGGASVACDVAGSPQCREGRCGYGP